MKLHSMGDIMNNFKPYNMAYCVKGALEGTFLVCNTDDENRLAQLCPNGKWRYDFYFGIPDEDADTRQWIFVEDVNGDFLNELALKFKASLKSSLENGDEITLVTEKEDK